MSEVGLVASHVPPADAKITRVGFYEVERTIGRGNYACVRYARHRVTKTEVAIKIVDKTRLDAENLIKVQREVDILKKLDHPHIIKLYQVMETENCIYLVTEFAPNGEIYDYVAQNKCLHEDEARRMFWQIVSALEYCHNLGIVHRDLKAENLLLDGNCCIKIADFGFSNFFGPDDLLKTFCGSPPYAAPEIFDGRPYKAEQLDVWSMGVVLYALVCGALPFEGANLQQLRLCVLSGRYRVPYFMSQECEQLLRRMLHVDPKKRATIAEVKNHAWMQKQNWEQCIEMEVKSCQLTTSEPNQYVLNTMESMGIDRNKIIKSLEERKFDNLMAIYLLMVDRLRVKQQEKMREREFGVIRTYTDPDLTNSYPTKDEMVSTVTRRARPPLFSIRDHPTFRTTDTTASSGIGDERASTLSRQSTIGTVGSIDEGVESDMAGSSTSHAAFSSGELVHIPMASGDFGPIDPNETDIFNCLSARTVIGAEALQVKQTAQGMNNSMNPCSSKPVSCNGMTMSPQSSFREGLRASDNTMFESLKSPFPTGQLRRGEGPLGETPEFKPPPEPVEQMQKMRIGPRHYAMNRTRQSAAGSLLSKRISLPENLEFQPQKLLNMKQSMHVEQQLGDGTNSTFEGKCALKARIQQKQRHIKSRMQLLKQQSYQAAHKQGVLPLSLRGPESFEAGCTGQLSPIEDIQREESMDAV